MMAADGRGKVDVMMYEAYLAQNGTGGKREYEDGLDDDGREERMAWSSMDFDYDLLLYVVEDPNGSFETLNGAIDGANALAWEWRVDVEAWERQLRDERTTIFHGRGW